MYRYRHLKLIALVLGLAIPSITLAAHGHGGYGGGHGGFHVSHGGGGFHGGYGGHGYGGRGYGGGWRHGGGYYGGFGFFGPAFYSGYDSSDCGYNRWGDYVCYDNW